MSGCSIFRAKRRTVLLLGSERMAARNQSQTQKCAQDAGTMYFEIRSIRCSIITESSMLCFDIQLPSCWYLLATTQAAERQAVPPACGNRQMAWVFMLTTAFGWIRIVSQAFCARREDHLQRESTQQRA
jgi:hypothetical protein